MKIKIVEPEFKLENRLCMASDIGKSHLDSCSPLSNGSRR